MTTFWGQLMEQVMGVLRNEKISASIIVFLIAGGWWVYSWAGEEFVKQEDFHDLKQLIVTHVEDMRIVNASQLIRDKELQLQIARATDTPNVTIEHMEYEINQAHAYRDCLIREEPNCKHLKPPE